MHTTIARLYLSLIAPAAAAWLVPTARPSFASREAVVARRRAVWGSR